MTQTTHRTIMISSTLMGAQQVVSLVVGVAQAKIVAVLLGTTGTGAFGIYASLMELGQSIFGLGVRGSGVRQIAAARNRHRDVLPSLDIRIQFWACLCLGALAGVTMFIFRHTLSRMTFGDTAYADGVAAIAAATAVALITTGMLSSLHGLRRIRDLTFVHIASSILSAMVAIGLVYAFREQGIAPAFLGANLCVLATAWLFFRRLPLAPSPCSLKELRRKIATLLRLGSGFLSASLCVTFTAYAVRALLVFFHAIEIAGLYQAAWMLSTFYCKMVLRAMGVDFFPRISAAIKEPSLFNRQINEQTEIGFLLVVPGLLLCMTAAAPVLRLLYAATFTAAVPAVRLMAAGMLVRTAGWPLTYVPLALNRPATTFLVELLLAMTLMGLSVICIPRLGLNGAALAFLITSLAYTGVHYYVARRLSGFRWSVRSGRCILATGSAGLSVFLLLVADTPVSVIAAWVVTLATVAMCGGLALWIWQRGER